MAARSRGEHAARPEGARRFGSGAGGSKPVSSAVAGVQRGGVAAHGAGSIARARLPWCGEGGSNGARAPPGRRGTSGRSGERWGVENAERGPEGPEIKEARRQIGTPSCIIRTIFVLRGAFHRSRQSRCFACHDLWRQGMPTLGLRGGKRVVGKTERYDAASRRTGLTRRSKWPRGPRKKTTGRAGMRKGAGRERGERAVENRAWRWLNKAGVRRANEPQMQMGK